MKNNSEKNMNEITKERHLTKDEYFSIIESLLFVSGEPLTLKQIASIIKLSTKCVKDLLKEMTIEYRQRYRGIKILNSGDKYSLVTKTENSHYVEGLLGNNSRQSLSQASLETMAIIAYKQPITRIDIDEIRGVKSDRAISTLLERQLIKENGRLSVPGRPILYGTTDEFLKYFGLENIDEIPDIEEFHLG